MYWWLDNPLIAGVALLTSVLFTTVAATIPPSGGNFIAGMFLSTFACFLGGDEEDSAYEKEIADEDI